MVETLYIHVGIHKTGTSSIQNFLFGYRDKMMDMGVYIPMSGTIGAAHHKVSFDALNSNSYNGNMETLQLLKIELKSCDLKSAVLTSEEFERFSVAEIFQILDVLEIQDVRPILFLRRQDSYMVSDYGQQIKMGATLPSFSRYLTKPSSAVRFNYLNTISNWATAGLLEQGSLMIYEDASANNQLLSNFLRVIGLSMDQEVFETGAHLNESWSMQETELARRITIEIKKRTKAKSSDLLPIYSEIYPEMKALCSEIPNDRLGITIQDYKEIARRYKPVNNLLVQLVSFPDEYKSHYLYETGPAIEIGAGWSAVGEQKIENLATRIIGKYELEAI